ncbi:heterokaryon incompatibility protein-domain-containing protein [Nemania sp. FL0031]|nr:heterokaryon incompatibility protein-domain-containing protein [Nemania sp. FL0031]
MGWHQYSQELLLRCTQFWHAFWTVSRSLILRSRTLRLPSYQYASLQDPSKDIRLATVLPGGYGDDIIIRIQHVTLQSRRPIPSLRLSIQEIQSTLPASWVAHETIEGRCLFLRTKIYGEGDPTWDHPNPDIERSVYQRGTEASRLPADGVVFDALSYVWGSYSWLRQRRALVEYSERGKLVRARISIGENLDHALRNARYADRPRVMWIDALCINQSDEDERNTQVTRMADIYSQASQVTVFLGPPGEGSASAIEALKHISDHVELLQNGQISLSPGRDAGFHRSDLRLPFNDETWEAVSHLMNRQWFTRLWVIQEVLLGDMRAKIVCGQSEILWTRFCAAVVAIYRNDFISDTLRGDMVLVNSLCTSHPIHEAVKYTFLMSSLRSCSDPRDSVYGTLGLLPPELRRRIRPDYSATLVEVFTNSTLAYINQTKRLEVLDISANGLQKPGFPSWVFDPYSFRTGLGMYIIVEWPGQFCTHFSECHVTHEAPAILRVLGFSVAKVASVKPRAPGRSECSSEEDCLRSCIQMVRSWEPEDLYEGTYVTGESLLEAYARTLICNDLRDRTPSGRVPKPERWQGQYDINPLFGEFAQEGDITLSDLTTAEKHPLEMLVGRRLLECENGSIGIGPSDAQSGDLICILLGHENPIVLREQQDGTHKMVGICYLHGVSDGVALLGPLPTPWKVRRMLDSTQQFMICKFYNPDTEVLCDEDPRLDPLGENWEKLPARNRTAGDPQIFQEFRDKTTGRIIKSDPRLSPEALRIRGLELQEFSIA